MRSKNLLAAALAALILVGAGCATKTNVAISPDEANSDSALTPRPLNLNREPQTAAPSEEAATSAPEGAALNAPENAQPSLMDNQPIQKTYRFPGILSESEIHGKQVRIQTDKGEIVFDLYDKVAPKTVSSFVYLANQGYYNALTFHRVVPGFVIQGGDPVGNGTGGPGYKFEDETIPSDLNYDAGIVAMANSGPNTNGSQFFIMLDDNASLPKAYTIFGRVTKGQDVVRTINVGDVMRSVTVEDKK